MSEEEPIQRMLDLYKKNFDLSTARISTIAERVDQMIDKVEKELGEMKETRKLLEPLLSSMDQQTTRLSKAVVALIQLNQMITDRYNQER